MIELARLHDRTGRCRFVLNETDRLPGIASGTFDFVYSNIVLQHVEPRFTRRYLAEFVRVLRPGGLLVFQLPAELVPVAPRGYKALVPEPGARGVAPAAPVPGVPPHGGPRPAPRRGRGVPHLRGRRRGRRVRGRQRRSTMAGLPLLRTQT